MKAEQRTWLRWMAGFAVLGVAGVAMAQKFAWPPTREAPRPAAVSPAEARPAAPEAYMGADQIGSASPIPTTVGRATTPGPVMPSVSSQIDWRVLENPNGPHVALIFDPVRQVFAVYHIDSAAGQIMLKSVRNLSADLRLDQFNSSNPAPKDIQSMLDEAR